MGEKYFLILYADDILLATNNNGMFYEMQQFLLKFFDMKDMGEATYVIGIEIHRERSRGILGFSLETYINKVLERFQIKACSLSVAPIVKVDKLSLDQCLKNDLEREHMKDILYASIVGSLMYAQVCTRSDITYVVELLGRYHNNPGLEHWRDAKKVLYLQKANDCCLFTDGPMSRSWLGTLMLTFWLHKL